jgi:hypothetical protein
MPILRPSGLISLSQRRFDRAIVILLAVVGMMLGAWEARECAAIVFGYVASYSYATAVFGAATAIVVAIPFLLYWRTRRFGVGLIALGVLSCVTFYASMAALAKADRVAWRHEPPPIRFGPDQKASAVVYFRKGVSDADIEQFISSVLQVDARPRHDGRDYPTFVESYLRLLPNQANGFEACAIAFRAGSEARNTDAYLAKIRADARVERVFLNTTPSEINLHPSGPTNSTNRK